MANLSLYRRLLLPGALILGSMAAGAVARPDPAPPSADAAKRSPFLGKWELDLTRMPATYGPPPRQVLYGFEEIGGGRWRTTVDITAQDGSVRHMAVAYRPDGTLAVNEGETSEADSAALMLATPTVLVMNLARNKMPGSVRVYTIAPGAAEMMESAAAVDDKGQPFVRNFHFRRVG